MKKILYLDRDGTLIAEPPDEQIDALEKFRLLDDVIPALLVLRDAGYRFVMVSNQDGLGTDAFPLARFEPLQSLLINIFATQGIVFDEVLIDDSFAIAPSPNRKPAIGMVMHHMAQHDIDWARCAMVGDRDTDMEFAQRLGVRGFKLAAGGLDWWDVVRELTRSVRFAKVSRETKETKIVVELDLDSSGSLASKVIANGDSAIRTGAPYNGAIHNIAIKTGLGFFDHMLEQIARHAGISLRIHAEGDLHIDEHHTIEDTALALGSALRNALGDKRGVARYGFADQDANDTLYFNLVMDEALARIALDLSGRAYFVFEGQFNRTEVGGMSTEMVPHFFRSLSESAGMGLNLQVRGENTHHMVEACFKAFGRALRMAIRREGTDLPSTKGQL